MRLGITFYTRIVSFWGRGRNMSLDAPMTAVSNAAELRDLKSQNASDIANQIAWNLLKMQGISLSWSRKDSNRWVQISSGLDFRSLAIRTCKHMRETRSIPQSLSICIPIVYSWPMSPPPVLPLPQCEGGRHISRTIPHRASRMQCCRTQDITLRTFVIIFIPSGSFHAWSHFRADSQEPKTKYKWQLSVVFSFKAAFVLQAY